MTDYKEIDKEMDEKFGYISNCIDVYTNQTYIENKKWGKEHLNDIKSFLHSKLKEAEEKERERILQAFNKRIDKYGTELLGGRLAKFELRYIIKEILDDN